MIVTLSSIKYGKFGLEVWYPRYNRKGIAKMTESNQLFLGRAMEIDECMTYKITARFMQNESAVS